MEENKEVKCDVIDDAIEQIKECIKKINEEHIQPSNIEYLYKSVDIYKDFLEIKEKEDKMRYNNYGNFDNYGTDYGRRYRGNYGRRGYDAKYRGEEMLDDVYQNYGEYMESGNYGGNNTKPLKYMLKSVEDFIKHLTEEAQSPEEIEMIKETARKISMM